MAAEKIIVPENTSAEPFSYRYDAIVVLGASMVWQPKQGKWTFPNIIQGEGLVGGKSRIIAAIQALEEELAPVILITGGVERSEGQVGFRSVAFRNEMLRRGVEPSLVRVLEHGDLPRGNTQGNIADIADFIAANPHVKRVGILTNEFHRNRGEAFVARTDMHGADVEFLDLHQLLLNRSPRFQTWIDAINSIPEMTERRRKEQKGVEDLESGRYVPTHG